MAFREGRDYQSQAQVTYMNYEPTTHLFLMYIVCCKKKKVFCRPVFLCGKCHKTYWLWFPKILKNNIHLLESVAEKNRFVSSGRSCHDQEKISLNLFMTYIMAKLKDFFLPKMLHFFQKDYLTI